MLTEVGYLVLCMWTAFLTADATVCNFGTGCKFPCRCENSDTCGEFDGACEGSCQEGKPSSFSQAGWSGPGCQTGNVAYDKQSWQYGTYQDWIAKRSVDGEVQRNLYGCSHPIANKGDNPWWMVDLGGPHRVYQIIYANTNEESFNYSLGMQFYVSNVSADENQPVSSLDRFTLCGQEPSVGRGADAVIDCQPPVIGQYVMVYKSSKAYVPSAFVMSEVIVKGHIYVPCDQGCPSCTDVYGCVDCPPGKKKSTLCTESCDPESYGPMCSESCSGHCKKGACNPVDGSCDQGCDSWWAGNKCDLPIDDITAFTGDVTFEVNSTTILLWWPHLQGVNSDLASFYGYKVKYDQTPGNEVAMEVSYSTTERLASAQITNLKFNTKYVTTITPFRRHGGLEDNKIDMAKSQTIRTKCISPGKAVISNHDLFNTSVADSYVIEAANISWTLSEDIGCNEITEVYMEYNTSSTKWESLEVETNKRYGIVNPYYPGQYQIRIKVVNNEEIASRSDPINVHIKDYGERPLTAGKIALFVCVVLVVLCLLIVACCFWRKHQNDKLLMEMEATNERILLKSRRRLSPNDIEVLKEESFPSAADSDEGVSFEDPPSHDDQISVDECGATDVEDLEIEVYATKSKEQVYENTSFVMRPIAMCKLENEFKRRLKLEDGLVVEVNLLPGPEIAPADKGKLPENKEKNRYRNILPYDQSLVNLERDTPTDSTYINANYLKGYNGRPRTYIATQGPKPRTKGDFWKMIWQLKLNVIIMLTPLVENRKKQSERYWPKQVGTTMEYGSMKVTLEAESRLADYTSRHLRVDNKGKSLIVTQYHYLSWPDKSVPKSTVSLMAFMHMLRGPRVFQDKPLVVHCSAGIGRTGTFIALDILLDQAAAECAVSVYSSVYGLRQDRPRMVQTLSQYTFLYEAMVDFAKTGKTALDASEFPTVYHQLKSKDGPSDMSHIEAQYLTLQGFLSSEMQSDAQETANMKKNRYQHILPNNSNRPYLSTPYKEGNDYINASFVDSIHAHNAYITTQAPLPNTIVDFWRLLYDFKCSTVIKLNKNESDCPVYWPETQDEPLMTGPLSVTLAEESSYTEQITKRRFIVVHTKTKEETYTDHYDVNWNSESPSTAEILDVVNLLESLHIPQRNLPVVIQCKDGVSMSGLLCTAAHAVAYLKVSQLVDVFVAARQNMAKNKCFINNLDQYDLLHQVVLHYLKSFDTYSNFV